MIQDSTTNTSLLINKPKDVQKQDEQKRKAVMRKLVLVLVLGICFVAGKIVGGVYSHSLLIISDAIHSIVDLLAYVTAIISVWVTSFPASKKHSFGFHRAGAIGAMVSVIALWVMNGYLVYLSMRKLMDTDSIEIHGDIMLYLSIFGLFLNLIMIYILNSNIFLPRKMKNKVGQTYMAANTTESRIEANIGVNATTIDEKIVINFSENEKISQEQVSTSIDDSGAPYRRNIQQKENNSEIFLKHNLSDESNQLESPSYVKGHITVVEKSTSYSVQPKEDLNIKSTIIHIIGDILQSISVIGVSVLIWISPDKMKIADPIITLFLVPFTLFLTFKVVKESILILMEGVPKGFDFKEFENALLQVDGVEDVHDLHVWSLGVGKNAMSAHIYSKHEVGPVLKKATTVCRMFNIYHSTIQVECTKDKKDKRYIDCEHKLH